MIALVSDAGMPLVSDPGYRLVTRGRRKGIPVQPIPGPSAAITALAGIGPAHRMLPFRWIPPAKPGQRSKALEALADEQHADLL